MDSSHLVLSRTGHEVRPVLGCVGNHLKEDSHLPSRAPGSYTTPSRSDCSYSLHHSSHRLMASFVLLIPSLPVWTKLRANASHPLGLNRDHSKKHSRLFLGLFLLPPVPAAASVPALCAVTWGHPPCPQAHSACRGTQTNTAKRLFRGTVHALLK